MDWNAVGAVAELIGALAVVISLVYLASQIRMSNTLAIAQTRRDMLHATQQELYKIVQHPDIFESFHKETLSREEKIRFNEWLIADMRGREFEWMQHRDGSLDTDTYESYRAVIAVNLGTRRTREWWKVNRIYFDPEFARIVDILLKDSSLTDFFSNIDNWN